MEDVGPDVDIERADEKSSAQLQVRPTAYLDGLRGLAALLVYLSHNVSWWYGPDTAFERGFGYHGEYMFVTFPFIRTIFTGGSAAVALFFVLSGYVLSISPLQMLQLGDVKETRLHLLRATLRRPFRLFLPVAAFSLIFITIMHLPFGFAPHLEWPKPEATIYAELRKWIWETGRVMNIWDVHSISTAWYPYNPPAWTMAAELRGSICVFGLLAASTVTSMSSLHRLWLFSLTGVCLLFLCSWEVAAFMFGVAIAMLNTDQRPLLSVTLTKFTSPINLTIFICGWYLIAQPAGGNNSELSSATPGWYYLTILTPTSYIEHEFWRFWTVIGAVMIIYTTTNITTLQVLLCRHFFRYLGRISFSLYLVHIPIAWTIGDRLARAFGKRRFDFSTPFDDILPLPDYGPVGLSTGFLIWQALMLPTNLYVASIATRRVEDPTKRFGKWLVSGLQRSPNL